MSVEHNSRKPRLPSVPPSETDGQKGNAGSQLSRRQFLEAAGFSLSLAMTGCGRAPTQLAMPTPVSPEGYVPGARQTFASTCAGCSAGCGMLVSVRDGRPLKMEGMPDHPISLRGGLCAVGQAQTIELYDSQRLRQPLMSGQPASWQDIDQSMRRQLEEIRTSNGKVRFVTSTLTSPTLTEQIDLFLNDFSDGKHITVESRSCSAILDAHALSHGVRVLPRFRFDEADVIVSLGADFLGTWISPVEFAAGWRSKRIPTPENSEMSYHVQLEGRMSLTGSNADRRIRLAPDEYGVALQGLAKRLRQRNGIATDAPDKASPLDAALLDELADRLIAAQGRSLVLCDSQDVNVQLLVNTINHELQNYGQTIDLQHFSLQRRENDSDLLELADDLRQGNVTALFVAGIDLLHNMPSELGIAESIEAGPLVVSFAPRADATTPIADFVCPDHHPLESWGDAEPVSGVVGLQQPTINPMWKTRSILESLAVWQGMAKSAYELLQDAWRRRLTSTTADNDFVAHWDQSVHDGLRAAQAENPPKVQAEFLSPAYSIPETNAETDFVLELHANVGMPDSRHAHNPWLHELPDPVTKITWGNYVSVSPAVAERKLLSEGDLVELSAGNDARVTLPVHIQIGQHDRVLAVALGYGVPGTDRFAGVGPDWLEARPTVEAGELLGVNAADMITVVDGSLQYVRSDVTLAPTGESTNLAATQLHHRLEVPPMVAPPGAELRHPIQRTTLEEYSHSPDAGAPTTHHLPDQQLWPEDHPKQGRHWGMMIDLNACTGCSACVIACQAENNIPVVGKDEVYRQREMHWMRIDRYYSGEGDELLTAHQPMMCHHCDNAPCETVCPVLATTHSDEGLNEQTYNRCVGTRYCANNCPYKVRRFNWFEYARQDEVLNLALNPDVTVRSRGVMEKCTMCVQRIEAGRIDSRRTGEHIADGQVLTACQQSCPSQAITFGDRNDAKSQVSDAFHDPRAYFVLEELNVRPGVGYLRQIKNRPAADDESAEASHE